MSRVGPTVLQNVKILGLERYLISFYPYPTLQLRIFFSKLLRLLQENMGYGHATLHVILKKSFKVGILPKAIGVGYYL